MIGQAVVAYRKLQMDMIDKLSVGSENVIDEVPFFDEGYIFTQIERLKKKYENVSRELKISEELNEQSDYEVAKREKLKKMLEKTELKIVYLSLNSFKSLEMCRKLVKGKDYKVTCLLQALEFYHNKDEKNAEEQFEQYFADNLLNSGYYLGNKIFGTLLFRKGETKRALQHLECAVQFNINDLELLSLMQEAYEKLGLVFEKEIVSEVIGILK